MSRLMRTVGGLASLAALSFVVSLASSAVAHAIDIQRVISPRGIEVWLVAGQHDSAHLGILRLQRRRLAGSGR